MTNEDPTISELTAFAAANPTDTVTCDKLGALFRQSGAIDQAIHWFSASFAR
jgi:hypothetical protein